MVSQDGLEFADPLYLTSDVIRAIPASARRLSSSIQH